MTFIFFSQWQLQKILYLGTKKKYVQRYQNENATSEMISTHCFFQTHTFQNAPTLINGPRSRKKVRLISRSCIVCSYSGKHSTNRYTMVNRICFPAHMFTNTVQKLRVINNKSLRCHYNAISYFCIFALVQTVYHIGILLIETCGISLSKIS